MAKITLYVRSSQNTGVINLRFRLRDGRTTQFFHPSNIEADVNDLKKLTNEGKPKPGVRIYNKDLVSKIEEESCCVIKGKNHKVADSDHIVAGMAAVSPKDIGQSIKNKE